LVLSIFFSKKPKKLTNYGSFKVKNTIL